jgi:hypothetical protein
LFSVPPMKSFYSTTKESEFSIIFGDGKKYKSVL